jgi:putative transposase
VPHHLTQRGVNRQAVFLTDCDRRIYLELALESAQRFDVNLLGYCLMTNHVHWIVIPERFDSLAKAFAQAHGRYAHYANAVLRRNGHFWQNRFFSCALEAAHLWAALRYTERNPVRAGLVEIADQWPWSSAGVHTGRVAKPDWLSLTGWSDRFTQSDWRSYLGAIQLADAERLLRIHTYTGRPLGSQVFIESAELTLGRRLQKSRGGRPAKADRPLASNDMDREAVPCLDA